jgi:hypothetical protein
VTAFPSESSPPEPLVVRDSLYAFDPELQADRRLLRLLQSDIPAAVLRGARPPAPRPKVSGPSVIIPVVGVMAAAIGVVEGQVGWAIGAVVVTVVALFAVTAVNAADDAPQERWAAVHAALGRTRRLAPGTDADELIAAVGRLRTATAGLPDDLAARVALRRNTLLWGLVAGIRLVRRQRDEVEPLRKAVSAKEPRAARVTAEAERAAASLRNSPTWGDVESAVAGVFAERDRSPHVLALRMAKAQLESVEERLATETAAVAVLRQDLDQLIEAAEAAASGERRGPEALAALLTRGGSGQPASAPPPPPPSSDGTPAPADAEGPVAGSPTAEGSSTDPAEATTATVAPTD